MNSFFGFHRAKQKHLYAMIHKLYYLSLANNASVLTRLIDSAEDEEYKEAMLAYFFLWRGAGEAPSPGPSPSSTTGSRNSCSEKTGVAINFEVADALTKLFRLGLVPAATPRAGLQRHAARPGPRALDRHWDDTFHYA